MSQFAVYEREGEFQAVKAGFSWPAFFFSGIWAFAKQMPGRGFALLGAFVGPLALGESGQLGDIGHALGHFAPIVVALTAGSLGNSWWRAELEDSGFEQLGTIDGESPEAVLSAWEKEELLCSDVPGDRLPTQAAEPHLN